MVSPAFVGGNYEEQLRTNPEGLAGVKVVWSGSSVKAFHGIAPTLDLEVLVLNLDELGPEPASTAQRLREATGVELVIITYSYARSELIQSLQSEEARVLQGPLSLAHLRSQMLSLIVRGILGEEDEDQRRERAEALVSKTMVSCPTCESRVPAERLRRAG